MPVDERAYFAAVNLVRRGELKAARNILQNMIQKREDDEQTWIWLAATYTSETARLRILEAAAKRYPNCEMVSKANELLQQRIEQQKMRAAEQEQASPPPASGVDTDPTAHTANEVPAAQPAMKQGEAKSAPPKKNTKAGDLWRLALAVGVVLLTILTAYLWTLLR